MSKVKIVLYLMVICAIAVPLSLQVSACKEDTTQPASPVEKSKNSVSIKLSSDTPESVVKDALLPTVPMFLKKLGESDDVVNSLSIQQSEVLASEGHKYLKVVYGTPKGEFGELLIKYVDPEVVKETSLELKNGQTILCSTELKAISCTGNCRCNMKVVGAAIECGCQDPIGGCTLRISD